MKKRILKTVTAGALTAAMVVSTSVAALAAQPFWAVNFNNGYDDLQTDENFEVVDNGAKPQLVEDSYGDDTIQVLELQPSTGDEVTYTDYAGATLKAGYAENSTIKLTNPFGTLGENYFREDWYDDYYDFMQTQEHIAKFNSKKQPAWENGATLSYWVKVPAADETDEKGRTVGLISNLFSWEMQDYQYQADDYAKYLAVTAAMKEIEENKENGVETNESGVTPDSDYYFEWQKNEDGSMYEYQDAKGHTGPVYLVTTNASLFSYNPNFKQGFDSNLEWNTYNEERTGYDTLPVITQTWADGTANGGKTSDKQEGESWDVGTSKVRFARTHSSMAIDSTSSIYWTNDDQFGVNRNSNLSTSLGQRAGMQNGDCFFLNSWQESDILESNTYIASGAEYLAESPYSLPDEWHLVTITMMNDWIEFYIDGEVVTLVNNESVTGVFDTYSSRGAATIDKTESFKRLNKGTGLRYGFGSEKNMGELSFGNYVCRLFLDWLTDEHVTFSIGGVNTINGNADLYSTATVTDKVKLAAIAAYDTVLTEDEIAAVYAAGPLSMTTANVLYGDVDENDTVNATDALCVLKAVVNLTTLTETQEKAADVDGKDGVTATDALLILKHVVNLIDKFPVEE